MDPDSDKKISEHVLRMHKYRNPGEQDGDRKNFFVSNFLLLLFKVILYYNLVLSSWYEQLLYLIIIHTS